MVNFKNYSYSFSQFAQMDGQVDSDGEPVVVLNDMVSHSNCRVDSVLTICRRDWDISVSGE
jgi:hypothetical protein